MSSELFGRAGRPDFLCNCGCREAGRASARGTEARSWACDGCGGGLMYQTQTCECGKVSGGRSHRTSTAGRPAMTGVEALRILYGRNRSTR